MYPFGALRTPQSSTLRPVTDKAVCVQRKDPSHPDSEENTLSVVTLLEKSDALVRSLSSPQQTDPADEGLIA